MPLLLLILLCNVQVAMNAAYDLGDDAWRQLGVEALRQGEWVSLTKRVYCYRDVILIMRSALEVVKVPSLT